MMKRFYDEMKDQLGEEIKISDTVTKREAVGNGWKYTFIFKDGELIDVWNN